ncbi:hypothetical protein BBO99_00009230 [Phytophthora kernoviae]|uniref:RWP-RK domain-containing protein n=1 Tax=Phytophthora kernoviae TaxID=325452 RepID=A0A3R7IW08_9STRA|nr:hypothetical protein JM18_009054 [Phytophthora kernoviae]RLN53919.1 hypothetical protein BBJ29_008465 [Phytophthora kernoviae]RLN73820.1 hypothetical protein BBO99_00009230 [Phytophthora kernoviae]
MSSERVAGLLLTPRLESLVSIAPELSRSMPFPMCAAPSTFNVAHPLHNGTAAYRNLQTPMTISTSPTVSPSCMTSPVGATSREYPVASPQKKARKSRVVFDFTTEEMAKYFHMSQREAAQQLGVATVTIKRNCRRLGIVWPYRLMKSKKHAMNFSAISREEAQRIRQERALARAKAGRSPSSRSPSACRSTTAAAEAAAKAMTMLSHSSSVEVTEAGRAFARLPLDCMDTDNY